MTPSHLEDLRAARNTRIREVARSHARALAGDRTLHGQQVTQLVGNLATDFAQALGEPEFQQQVRQAAAVSQLDGYTLVSARLRRMLAAAFEQHAEQAAQAPTELASRVRFAAHGPLALHLELEAENRARACPGPDQASNDAAWSWYVDYATTPLISAQRLADLLSQATDKVVLEQARADITPRQGLGGLIDRITGQADAAGRRPAPASR